MATEAHARSHPLAAQRPRNGGPHYERHRPEESVLYAVVQQELETFLARAAARERPLPRFVERELREFLRCGILAHGFARVHCDTCGFDRLVAFSCKGRGFCPSCGGRRMADTAAQLVDRVLPEVPIRQWVLSFPFALRFRMAHDSRLTREVLGLFIRTVFSSLRRRARVQWGLARSQCGAVTFVQRFGDAFRLNVHAHSLVLDGVYARAAMGLLRFYPLPPPTDAEVARVASRVAKQTKRLLERRGIGDSAEPGEADPLAEQDPLLAELYAASIASRVASGPRAGQRLLRLGDRIDPEMLPALEGERCASASGFSLHANVAVPARDRPRLERLCRYAGRPALATERLSRLDDGRLLYRLKQRWRDGTTHVVLEPSELLEKLAALVPPPRFHLVRYHGILGPCASERDRVVPGATGPRPSTLPSASAASRDAAIGASLPGRNWTDSADPVDLTPELGIQGLAHPHESRQESISLALPFGAEAPALLDRTSAANPRLPRPRRLSWAELLRRVFAIDVLACPRCEGRLRLLAAIHSEGAAQSILGCLGLATRAPPIATARCDPSDPEAAGDWNPDPDYHSDIRSDENA
jgi:hypothetical protein